jgi:trk system potassium uptake protein TrkA
MTDLWARFGTGRRSQRIVDGEQVLVLGLGRFGGAVAAELVRLGFDVLGVDSDAERVREYTKLLTHVVEGDFTNADVLRQLGAAEMNYGVVAVGSDIEASILATAALDDIGVPNIWAKAVTQSHGRILSRVGAHHVVYPEHDMGHRVAHMLGGRMIDWFHLDETFSLIETLVPAALVGLSLTKADLRARYEVTVVCVKPKGGCFTYATPDTVLSEGDIMVIAGENKAAEAFARLC